MSFRIRSEAKCDFAEAIEFYIGEETPQSARRFMEEVDRVYDAITEHPNRYPANRNGLRAWPLDRHFPFQVLYTIDDNSDITVIAVHHTRRSKKYLRDRT